MRAAAVLSLLLLATAASAQVNTERLRALHADDPFAITLDGAVAVATGNTEFLQVGVGGRADVRVGRNVAFAVGRYDFAKQDGDAYLDRFFVHGRITRRVRGPLSADAFSQLERNRQQRLDTRLLVGGGLRLDLVEADSASLALGVTPMVEFEVLDEALGGEQDAVLRVSSYLAGRLDLDARTALSAVVYAQPRATAPDDFRVLAQASLNVGLTRALALRVRLNVRHDSRPPGEVERTDLSVENGLVVTLPGG